MTFLDDDRRKDAEARTALLAKLEEARERLELRLKQLEDARRVASLADSAARDARKAFDDALGAVEAYYRGIQETARKAGVPGLRSEPGRVAE